MDRDGRDGADVIVFATLYLMSVTWILGSVVQNFGQEVKGRAVTLALVLMLVSGVVLALGAL